MPTNPPTKDDFAKLMTDRIRQAGEKGCIVYEPEEFRLRGEGERTAAIFLHNAYKEYCSADEDVRERVVRHWVRNWFSALKDAPEEFEDAKPDLMPVVRSRSHFDINRLRGEVESDKPGSWPYQVLGEHFGAGLVYGAAAGSLIQHGLNLISRGKREVDQVGGSVNLQCICKVR